MTTIQYENLKKFMKDSFYTFTDEWLTACVEWVKENFPSAQITNQFLKEQIFEQWMGTDLQEMESRCLPPSLNQKKFTELNGKYGLQINSVQDIGESAYSQINKIKKTVNENASVEATDSTEYKPSWQPRQRRCLYLTMTDGSQVIFGLELVSIPSISLAIKPGAKIIIIGPVSCRRGVVELKPSNVKFIGGEVEGLLTINSVENVLTRALNPAVEFTEDNNSNDSLMEMVANSIDLQLREEQYDFSRPGSVEATVSTISATVPATISATVPATVPAPVSVSQFPYIFLKQVRDEWDKHISTRKVLNVKACVATLLSNINVNGDQWALDVCINDGSDFLNCTISSALLSEVIGFTPTDMKQLKKTPEGKLKIVTRMKLLTGTLIQWNGIFGIEAGNSPLIVMYNEIMLHHIAALKERLSRL